MARLRFSERAGHKPVQDRLQTHDINEELRNCLWSVFYEHVLAIDTEGRSISTRNAQHQQLYRSLWKAFFKYTIDTLPDDVREIKTRLKEWFIKEATWFEVYDFIEFVAPYLRNGQFGVHCNNVLEREVAGYRLADSLIMPITDEHELATIQGGLETARTSGLVGVAEHLRTALDMLSDRENPDYRNSVKESISAVESLAKIISDNPKAELGPALDAIEEKTPFHGALRQGFKSLYGYASDEGGIRHALLNSPSVDLADAKYMLATCSAFVNFLVLKAAEGGIRLGQPGLGGSGASP